MPIVAKLYSAFVIIFGGAALIVLALPWESHNSLSYACYLALSLIFCGVKVSLPPVSGSLPLFTVFVLLGVLEFSLPETLLLGCLGTLAYAIARSKAREGVLKSFTMAITISVSYAAFHSRLLQGIHLEIALTISIAIALFFTVDTFGMAAWRAVSNRESLLYIWRENYAWSFPLYVIGAILAGLMSILTRMVGWQTGLLVVPVFYLAYRFCAVYLARIQDGKTRAEQTAVLHLRTIEALALAIEAKDRAASNRLRRVQVYALEVGKELGLSDFELEALRSAALLHDIGKLAVPDHILFKPGKLTREEFEKMKIHPSVGAEILERVGFPYPVTPIIRHHHEKWNGTGYPDGLKGDEIPVGARILAAVDCLDALASDRQYRRANALEDAMRKVAADSGSSFDPRVVDVLKRRCRELEKLAVEQLEDSTRLLTEGQIEQGPEPARGQLRSRQTNSSADCLTSIASASQEVQTLFEFAQDLGNSLSLSDTLSLVAQRLKRIIPYDTIAIFVPSQDVLRPEFVAGDQFRVFSSLAIPFGQGLSGWVAQTCKSIINGDPAAEPGYICDDTESMPMRSALSQPLVGLNGLTSVLTLYRWEPDAFTQDHLRLMMAVAPMIALAIENALKYQQAESSAATDFMTGLPNARSLFLHLDGEVARCRRTRSPLVVMVCDMNGFKQVNDKFGHLKGNDLLHAVADKLKESCREYDYVARMGGDEFVLIFPGLTLDQVHLKTIRLNALTKDAGREVCGVETLGLSIGHACYPDDGSNGEQLLGEADRRMYLVKQKEKLRLVEPRGFDFDEMVSSKR